MKPRRERRASVQAPPQAVLTINAGSSSIRFALFQAGPAPQRLMDGKIDRIGLSDPIFMVNDSNGLSGSSRRICADDHGSATKFLLKFLAAQPAFASVRAVGHRVVHGMRFSRPQRINAALLEQLRRIAPYDPDHLPREIQLIQAFRRQYPRIPQIACFDTAFHCSMPPVARLLPIPRRYVAKGVRRYGFHGLSYAFLIDELIRLGDPAARKGRVILAHLGNGASLAAVRAGKSMDTSMGFSPASGLMMSTRSGDLDPGVISFLSRTEAMTAARFQKMVNHESGLLGVSGVSSDMRDLLARESTDSRAAEALDSPVDHMTSRRGGGYFDHRDLPSRRLVPRRVHHPCGFQGEQPSLLDLNACLRYPLQGESAVGKRLAERGALVRPTTHPLQHPLRQSD